MSKKTRKLLDRHLIDNDELQLIELENRAGSGGNVYISYRYRIQSLTKLNYVWLIFWIRRKRENLICTSNPSSVIPTTSKQKKQAKTQKIIEKSESCNYLMAGTAVRCKINVNFEILSHIRMCSYFLLYTFEFYLLWKNKWKNEGMFRCWKCCSRERFKFSTQE